MAGAASPLLLRLLRPGEPEDDEEEEAAAVVPGRRRRLLPRCSPTPRPRSPQEEAAALPEAAAGPGRRRVRFADALGLPLLELRSFSPEMEPEPGPPAVPVPCLEFSLPASEQQLLERLERGAALELESLGLCAPGEEDVEPPALRGLVRVRNLSYSKAVVVRASWDGWSSFRDHPARYVPGSSDGVTDRFAFCLPCAGRRLEFVLRYQTPSEVFWANNQGHNYGVLLLPGTGEGILPPPPSSAIPLLKSCLKPPRSRLDEESPGIESGEDTNEWDDNLRKLLKPNPLKAEHLMQVPELMVTGTFLDRKDSDSDQSVAFPEPNLPADTERKSRAEDHGKLPNAVEREQEAGEAAFEHGTIKEIDVGKEEPSVHKDLSVNREMHADLTPRTHSHDGLMQEQPEPNYLDIRYMLPLPGEYDSEDMVVEEEMEQLYLSHLNRLRAEEELKSCGARAGAEQKGVLLLGTSLHCAHMGPVRPRNSLLVEEISQHYTNGEGDLSDDAEEPEESMAVPPSSVQLPCWPGEEQGEKAVPGRDPSPHPVEDMSTGKDWIAVADGNCAEILESVPLTLLEKEFKRDNLGGEILPGSSCEETRWHLLKEEDTRDIALLKTESSAALLIFPLDVANEGADVTSSLETSQNICETELVRLGVETQEHAVDMSAGTAAAWEPCASVHQKTQTAKMSPNPLQGEASLVLQPSPALATALSQSFRFLCILVFLPALLDGCTSLVAVVLHLMSAWFL